MKNTYTCVFESEQICGKLNGNLYIRVRQSCTAQRIGKQVAIKTKVDKILERRPTIPYPEDYYLADNFILQLSNNKAGDERLALRRTAAAEGALLARRRADLVNDRGGRRDEAQHLSRRLIASLSLGFLLLITQPARGRSAEPPAALARRRAGRS